MNNNYPEVFLCFGKMDDIPSDALRERLSMVQDRLFDALGLISPLVQLRVDDSLPSNEYTLIINGKQLEPMVRSESEDLLTTVPSTTEMYLRQFAAELMTARLTERYLEQIDAKYGVLVKAVRDRFATTDVMQVIQSKLRMQTSVKNLREILETMLIEDNQT